ncbi:MAG: ABC transporter ATP-binding protein [Pseudomonadota bacterium]
MNQSVIVKFDDVQKSYDGENLVVKKFNMDLLKGEFLTLLGPSGSGKTTVLMMLAGFETPTAGNIYLEDRPIDSVPPNKRDIGMVFQNYALFPHMSVAENLAFPLQVRSMSKSDIEARVRRALEMVRLDHFGNRRPGQLSGGQQQRVAVARALVFEPNLVLMDEPLGALDKNLREEMQYEIKHIHENIGVSIVYVTHDQSEALTMSNRVAVFNDGVVQQLSSPDILYEKPDNAFVAGFIGENNRLYGTVTRVEKDRCYVKLDQDEEGQGEIEALAINIDGVGSRTTLSIRPERVFVEPDKKQQNNQRKAKVIETIYLGDHIRTRVRICGNEEFIVKIPNTGRQNKLHEGEDVLLGWAAHDCRALDYKQ